MKQIKLLNLNSKNFKGVKEFSFNFDAKNVDVYGENHTGKTSIKDMFFWCLTGKDGFANDETSFGLRPIDKNGKEVHDIIISVKLELSIDGKITTLERRKVEKVSKIRGTLEEKITETTECEIDGVPKKVTEFENFVKENIIDKDKIFLLSNPDSFNDLHWKKQREVLVTLANNLSDLELTKQNQDYSVLIPILESNYTLDDYNKVLERDIKALQKDLDAKPYQINELSNLDFKDVENLDLEKVNEEISKIKEELSTGIITNPNESKVNELRAKKQALVQARIDKFNNELLNYNNIKSSYEKNTRDKRLKLESLSEEVRRLKRSLQSENANLETLNKDREKLLEEYKEIKTLAFTGSTCPYCGQNLPKDKLNEHLEKFNEEKASKLEGNIARGKRVKEEITKGEEIIANLEQSILEKQKEFEDVANTEILEVEVKYPMLDEETDLEREIEAEISSLINLNKPNEDLLMEKQNRLQANLRLIERHKTYLETLDRIGELRKEQQEKALTLNDKKLLKETISLFISYKCSLIEEKINSSFKNIKFKLFDIQKNGGVVETCEATLNGVPFRNLSNSERINTGIDVINTLQTIYNVNMPIIVDNAESITTMLETAAQVIALYVLDEPNGGKLEFYINTNN